MFQLLDIKPDEILWSELSREFQIGKVGIIGIIKELEMLCMEYLFNITFIYNIYLFS